ncbi:MAG TPA: type III-A CRISPR-associated RAMP protein Csm5 [Clostridia bacterium]|nr:type III-A CRISPR-associated RAMP protein Csm5 [Clostridia bacterium]
MTMKLKLETLTAVNVGNGEIASQFSDYVYDGGFVYYLNHDLLLRELGEKPKSEEIIEEFVKVVQSQAKGSSGNRMRLKDFLEKNGLDYRKYALRKIPARERITEQIQLHIKSGSQPYIPGSSLKGAIRTALISFFLDSSEEGLKNKRKYIGQDLFGEFGEDVLKCLLVSDTLPFEEEDLEVVVFKRLNLKSKKSDIPVVKEVIRRGSVTTFTIKTKAKENQVKEEFAFLQAGKEDSLFEIINKYSRKNIEIELELLSRFRGEETKEIEDFYTTLLQRVENADHAKEAYLRIGSGKTFFDNTIGQKLSKQFIADLVRKNFRKADPNFFPKTWSVIRENLSTEVPGWVRIAKEDYA